MVIKGRIHNLLIWFCKCSTVRCTIVTARFTKVAFQIIWIVCLEHVFSQHTFDNQMQKFKPELTFKTFNSTKTSPKIFTAPGLLYKAYSQSKPVICNPINQILPHTKKTVPALILKKMLMWKKIDVNKSGENPKMYVISNKSILPRNILFPTRILSRASSVPNFGLLSWLNPKIVLLRYVIWTSSLMFFRESDKYLQEHLTFRMSFYGCFQNCKTKNETNELIY